MAFFLRWPFAWLVCPGRLRDLFAQFLLRFLHFTYYILRTTFTYCIFSCLSILHSVHCVLSARIASRFLHGVQAFHVLHVCVVCVQRVCQRAWAHVRRHGLYAPWCDKGFSYGYSNFL